MVRTASFHEILQEIFAVFLIVMNIHVKKYQLVYLAIDGHFPSVYL